MNSLNKVRIQNDLKVITVGREILIEDEISSTNELVKSYRKRTEGLAVLADRQTQGRGRLGRNWHSPSGLGIYLSVLLKPKVSVEKIAQSTLMAGVALADAVKPFLQDSTPILKWPNDVLLNGLKLAGILCEYCPSENNEDGSLVVGIGVNINHQVQDFPEDLQSTAVSLLLATGSKIDRELVIHSILKHLDDEYHSFLNDDSTLLIQKWSERTNLFGKKLSLNHQGQIYSGTATRLDELGRLVLQLKDGETMHFNSGEIINRE